VICSSCSHKILTWIRWSYYPSCFEWCQRILVLSWRNLCWRRCRGCRVYSDFWKSIYAFSDCCGIRSKIVKRFIAFCSHSWLPKTHRESPSLLKKLLVLVNFCSLNQPCIKSLIVCHHVLLETTVTLVLLLNLCRGLIRNLFLILIGDSSRKKSIINAVWHQIVNMSL
jgi:hypothetical protein